MELFRPKGSPQPRRPTDTNQKNGPIINPPRMAKLGGLSATSKIGATPGLAVSKPADGKKVI